MTCQSIIHEQKCHMTCQSLSINQTEMNINKGDFCTELTSSCKMNKFIYDYEALKLMMKHYLSFLSIRQSRKIVYPMVNAYLTLLHFEQPKLHRVHRVLAVQSATGLSVSSECNRVKQFYIKCINIFFIKTEVYVSTQF